VRVGFGAIVAAVLSGFLIGSAARFAVPGPDPMPFWLTVLIGLVGSVIGGAIAVGLYGANHITSNSGHVFITVMLEIVAAAGLVALYRRFVQRRPLAGPEAYRFPTRGFGIARMRDRLRRLGVDPDTIQQGVRPGPAAPGRGEQDAEKLAAERADLAERHERGEISDEEYEQERQRLRRF
jgi:uncharacterized membrane protein YeaQ/YmgE (transglycosylase-associated protein family)